MSQNSHSNLQDHGDPGPSTVRKNTKKGKRKICRKLPSISSQNLAKPKGERQCAMVEAGKECETLVYLGKRGPVAPTEGHEFCRPCIDHIPPYVLIDRAQDDEALKKKIREIYKKRVQGSDIVPKEVVCMSQDLDRMKRIWGVVLLRKKRDIDRRPGEGNLLYENCDKVLNNYQLCDVCTEQLQEAMGFTRFCIKFDVVRRRANEWHHCLKSMHHPLKNTHRNEAWYKDWKSEKWPEVDRPDIERPDRIPDPRHMVYIPNTLCTSCILEHHTRSDFQRYFTSEGFPKWALEEPLYVNIASE